MIPLWTRSRYLRNKERHEVKLYSDGSITTMKHDYGCSDRISVILTAQEKEEMQDLPIEAQATYIKWKILQLINWDGF